MENDVKILDEIVFEQRNQNYGAFFLRKNYNKNLSGAMAISLLLISAVISIPLIAGYVNKGRILDKVVTIEMKTPLIKPNEKVETPKPPDAEKSKPIMAFRSPRIVDSIVETPFFPEVDSVKNGVTTDTSSGVGLVELPTTKPPVVEVLPQPLIVVEQMPEFKGGSEALYKWLAGQIKYPDIAKEINITGTVVVTFVVERDGSITGVQLLKEVAGGCSEEAVRVVKSMPAWNPGRQNGQAVRVQFNLPIKFILQ